MQIMNHAESERLEGPSQFFLSILMQGLRAKSLTCWSGWKIWTSSRWFHRPRIRGRRKMHVSHVSIWWGARIHFCYDREWNNWIMKKPQIESHLCMVCYDVCPHTQHSTPLHTFYILQKPTWIFFFFLSCAMQSNANLCQKRSSKLWSHFWEYEDQQDLRKNPPLSGDRTASIARRPKADFCKSTFGRLIGQAVFWHNRISGKLWEVRGQVQSYFRCTIFFLPISSLTSNWFYNKPNPCGKATLMKSTDKRAEMPPMG